MMPATISEITMGSLMYVKALPTGGQRCPHNRQEIAQRSGWRRRRRTQGPREGGDEEELNEQSREGSIEDAAAVQELGDTWHGRPALPSARRVLRRAPSAASDEVLMTCLFEERPINGPAHARIPGASRALLHSPPSRHCAK